MGRGAFCNACGYSINEHLTPADIETGVDARARIRQRGGNCRGEEVGGGEELFPRCVRAGEDDQVPLGCPPAGGHANTGESRNGGEGVIAGTHEARGQDPGLGLEGSIQRMTGEAQHEAGSYGGWSRLCRRGRGLGLSLAGTFRRGLGRLRRGSGRGVGGGGPWRGRGGRSGRRGSRGRPSRKVRGGLLHLSLPLWLGSRGPEVLGRGTGGHNHGDVRGGWWATVGVRIHVVIGSDTGWGEAGREDGPRRDWRDRGVRAWVKAGEWEVAESADCCEGVVDVGTIRVGLL